VGRTVRFTVYTLFPALIEGYLGDALLEKAQARGLLEVVTRDLRRFAGNRTNRVDDAPYGGGAGMVIRVDVAAAALAEVAADDPPPEETILLSPAGEPLTQALVEELAGKQHVMLLSGRYEGFDARVESSYPPSYSSRRSRASSLASWGTRRATARTRSRRGCWITPSLRGQPSSKGTSFPTC